MRKLLHTKTSKRNLLFNNKTDSKHTLNNENNVNIGMSLPVDVIRNNNEPIIKKENTQEELQKVKIVFEEFERQKKEVQAGLSRLTEINQLMEKLIRKYQYNPELISKQDNDRLYMNLEMLKRTHGYQYMVNTEELPQSDEAMGTDFEVYCEKIEELIHGMLTDMAVVQSEILTLAKNGTSMIKELGWSNIQNNVQKEVKLNEVKLRKCDARLMELTERIMKELYGKIIVDGNVLDQNTIIQTMESNPDAYLDSSSIVAMLSKDATVDDNVKAIKISKTDMLKLINKVAEYFKFNKKLTLFKEASSVSIGVIAIMHLIHNYNIGISKIQIDYLHKYIEEFTKTLDFSNQEKEHRVEYTKETVNKWIDELNQALENEVLTYKEKINTTVGNNDIKDIVIDHRDMLEIMKAISYVNLTNEDLNVVNKEVYNFLSKIDNDKIDDTDMFYSTITIMAFCKYLLENQANSFNTIIDMLKQSSSLVTGYVSIIETLKELGDKL